MEERGTPEVLHGKTAVGLVCVPELQGAGFVIEAGEGQLATLAEIAGLDLKKTFAERGWSEGIEVRPQIREAIEALRSGEAEVIMTHGPSAVGPTIGEHRWFAEQVTAAGGLWWMGGGVVIPRQEGEPTFGDELERFREEVERG